MTEPSIAVLLASYNGASFIGPQIRSILAQEGAKVTIFVRDDSSSDATLEIVRQISTEFSGKIHLVEDEIGRAGAAAENFFRILDAVDVSAYDYLSFADQDDVWFPEKLSRATSLLDSEKCDGYSSNLIAYNSALRSTWLIKKDEPSTDLDYLFQGASAGCTYVLSNAAASLVKKVMTPEVRRECTSLSHDWGIYAICRSHGLGWAFDPVASIMYRQHNANQYGARPGISGFIRRARMVQDSWYRDHILWLQHVVVGSPLERSVFERLRKPRWRDRYWLMSNASRFRRRRRDAMLLRLALLAGKL